MKRFAFNLEAVLKQRGVLLEVARRTLGERLSARVELDALIEADVAALEIDDAPPQGALFDPRRAALRGRHRAGLRAALDRRREARARLDEEIEAARAAVAEAHQAVKVMERLKEKARDAWAAEARQAEQKEADEQSQLRRR